MAIMLVGLIEMAGVILGYNWRATIESIIIGGMLGMIVGILLFAPMTTIFGG